MPPSRTHSLLSHFQLRVRRKLDRTERVSDSHASLQREKKESAELRELLRLETFSLVIRRVDCNGLDMSNVKIMLTWQALYDLTGRQSWTGGLSEEDLVGHRREGYRKSCHVRLPNKWRRKITEQLADQGSCGKRLWKRCLRFS